MYKKKKRKKKHTNPPSPGIREGLVTDTETSEASPAAGRVPIMGLNFAAAVTTLLLSLPPPPLHPTPEVQSVGMT